jgi:hypothetical protein
MACVTFRVSVHWTWICGQLFECVANLGSPQEILQQHGSACSALCMYRRTEHVWHHKEEKWSLWKDVLLFGLLPRATYSTSHRRNCSCELLNYMSTTAFCKMLQTKSRKALKGIAIGKICNVWYDHYFSYILYHTSLQHTFFCFCLMYMDLFFNSFFLVVSFSTSIFMWRVSQFWQVPTFCFLKAKHII